QSQAPEPGVPDNDTVGAGETVVLVRSAGTGGRRRAAAPAGQSPGKMGCSTLYHGRNSHKPRTRPDTPGSHRFSFGEPSPPRGLHVPLRHYAPSAAANGTQERPRACEEKEHRGSARIQKTMFSGD